MHTEAMYVGVDAHQSAIVPDYLHVYRSWMQVFGECLADVVLHRPEERAVEILFVFCLFQIGPAGAFKQKGTVSLCMSLILIF